MHKVLILPHCAALLPLHQAASAIGGQAQGSLQAVHSHAAGPGLIHAPPILHAGLNAAAALGAIAILKQHKPVRVVSCQASSIEGWVVRVQQGAQGVGLGAKLIPGGRKQQGSGRGVCQHIPPLLLQQQAIEAHAPKGHRVEAEARAHSPAAAHWGGRRLAVGAGHCRVQPGITGEVKLPALHVAPCAAGKVGQVPSSLPGATGIGGKPHEGGHCVIGAAIALNLPQGLQVSGIAQGCSQEELAPSVQLPEH